MKNTLKKFRIPIGELFTFFNLNGNDYDIPKKISRLLKIKTADGKYTDILYLIKKFGKIYNYKLENGIEITCDENHLVKSNGKFTFIKDCTLVDTINGSYKIINSTYLKDGDVYDMSLNDPHEYITSSGIICHNTTLAKIIVKNIPCDCVYINASDTNGIEMVRTKIKGFAGSAGFQPLKVIILDECLDENTFVYVLRKGIETKVKIKDVNENEDLIKSFNIKQSKIEWRTFYLWDKGEQECVRIELENGESVICTLDHKWYVLNDKNEPIKVKTKELVEGKYDCILSPE
jgi:intein/homing endonuclease